MFSVSIVGCGSGGDSGNGYRAASNGSGSDGGGSLVVVGSYRGF